MLSSPFSQHFDADHFEAPSVGKSATVIASGHRSQGIVINQFT
jgi:hypothetical protein